MSRVHNLVLIIVAAVLWLALAVLNIMYTNHVDRSSSHEFCDLLNMQAKVYEERKGELTSTGKDMARETDRLRERFDC